MRAQERGTTDIGSLETAAVLFHPERERAVDAAGWISQQLRENGVDVYSGPAFDQPTISREVLGRQLVLGLGGDGTILSLARDTAGTGIPILGINLGRVGFLAELTPELVLEALPRILAGEYWIETRIAVEARWKEGNSERVHLAVNEVALARGASTRAIRVAVSIDREHYLTHTADGVIISTATGSTAYSLAAGGPIIYPESHDLLVTPVAPHLHIGRSMIVPGTSVVELELWGDREAMLAIDGQTECPFQIGDKVEIRRSAKRCRFVRLGPQNYFYAVLADRLQ